MRACIISLTILLSIVALSILNALYIDNTCQALIELEKSFPDKQDGESSPDQHIERSKELWEKSYKIIILTVHCEAPNKISLALEHLISCYLHGTRADYLSARAAYLEAIRSLSSSERISFQNVI